MIDVIEGPVYQWDIGRQVMLAGDDRDASEVHFAPAGSSENAISVRVRDRHGRRTAEIPNSLLTKAQTINAWTWGHDRTIHALSIKVQGRNKPSGYVYTPTEQETFEKLEKWVRKELRRIQDQSCDYEALDNKPSINGVVLQGDMEFTDFGLTLAPVEGIDRIFEEKEE